MTSHRTSGRWGARAAAALVVVAAAKVVVGLTLVGLAPALGGGRVGARHALLAAFAVAFAVPGGVLVAARGRDHRAGLLGAAFLLVASVFADPLATPWRGAAHPALALARGVLALQVDAFMPYFLWRFARDFPRTLPGAAQGRWFAWANRACLASGGLLFAGTLAWSLAAGRVDLAGWVAVLRPLSRHEPGSAYWPIQLGLVALALAALFRRTRGASREERRRVGVLTAALVVGALPTVAWVLLSELVPSTQAVLPLAVAGWVVYPTLLAVPCVTAHAVLVQHALGVRLLVRRAVQYALARYSVIGTTALSLLGFAASLYRHRDASVAAVVAQPSGMATGALAALGLATWQWRGRLLERIDRRFFREQHDARVILGQLVDRCRAADDARQLAAALAGEIDRALHPEAVHVLLRGATGDVLAAPDGSVAALSATTALAALLARREEPLPVDLERPHPDVAALADADRHWLADAGARLVVPIREREGALVGAIALGAKRSELPYSEEDRALLQSVAGAAQMALASRGLGGDPTPSRPAGAAEDRAAAECVACGGVYPAEVAPCPRCGEPTREAALPRTIAGKFVVERLVGAGGMGVVYRAVDVTLDRPVAIKTLPVVAPEETVRLRREARAMAVVRHEHLAMIYGVETWRGRPMLVVEYLGGGTLADRLRGGPLLPGEVVALGVALADVLAAIHRAGVLHGDVKPSNIGYSLDGVPKLLDFGLARLVGVGTPSTPTPTPTPRRDGRRIDALPVTAWPSESVAHGTPRYMSPEAREGHAPSPADDLWSLAVVLREALGVPPGDEPLLPDRGDDGHGLGAFFAVALALDRKRRPRTAAELGGRLRHARILDAARASAAALAPWDPS